MTPPNQNPAEVLSEEILAEAKREGDEIIRRAQEEAAALLAAATAEAGKIRRERMEAARTEAARRTELTLATVPVEAGRLRSARREAILESIHEEARRQLLACVCDNHETVVALAANAIRRMPGADYVLKISAADHAAFGDKLAEEIRQRTGRSAMNVTVSVDPAMTGPGVIVEDALAARVWDNRLGSRLERLWPELRRQIAIRASLIGENHLTGGGT